MKLNNKNLTESTSLSNKTIIRGSKLLNLGLAALCVFTLGGCSLLNQVATTGGEVDDVIAYVAGSPWGNVNGYLGTISEPSTGNFEANTTFSEISITANDVKEHNGYIYVVHSGSQSLMKIDPETNSQSEISLGEGLYPWAIEIVNEKAFITNNTSHSVTVVDLASFAVETTIDLPTGNALNPPTGATTYAYPEDIIHVDGTLYVALTNQDASRVPTASGLIAKINPTTYALEGTIGPLTGSNARSFAYDDQYPSILFVIQSGVTWPADNQAIAEAIDLDTETSISHLTVNADSEHIAIHPDGNVYVSAAYAGAQVFDLSFSSNTLALSDTITITGGTTANAIYFDNQGRLFVIDYSGNQVHIQDANTGVFSTVDVNSQPTALAFSPADAE